MKSSSEIPQRGSDNGNVLGITTTETALAIRALHAACGALNRLASAHNPGTDCSVTVLGGNKKFWGNTYTYDAWGNLITKAIKEEQARRADEAAEKLRH